MLIVYHTPKPPLKLLRPLDYCFAHPGHATVGQANTGRCQVAGSRTLTDRCPKYFIIRHLQLTGSSSKCVFRIFGASNCRLGAII